MVRALTSDLILPLGLLLTYIIFLVVIRGYLPTTDEILTTFANLYARFGYEIILIASFLEALILVNLFVPGQIAMALGVIFAREGHTELTLVLISATIGAIGGYALDYLLGYFGFADVLRKLGYGHFLDQAKRQLNRYGRKGLMVGFIHSNIGAFLSLVAGTINFPWRIFAILAVISTLFWVATWGVVVYLLGDIILVVIRRYSWLLLALMVAAVILTKFWNKEERGS